MSERISLHERKRVKAPAILVVSHDLELRSLALAILSEASYQVKEAGNNLQAIDIFKQRKPDMILLDADMPGGEAFTICKSIRKKPSGKQLPILIITSPEDGPSVNAAFEAGGTDILIKPLQGSVLRVRAYNLLQASRVGKRVKAMTRAINIRRQTEMAIRESQVRYEHIFQSAGVSIWVEDFSKVKQAIDKLKAQGVVDFEAYFDAHPEFVIQTAQLIQILDVNRTTLKLQGAQTKAELLGALDKVMVPETLEIMRAEFIAIANGVHYFVGETVNRTLQGKLVNILITIIFPEEPDPFDNILISTMDITRRVQAELGLRQSAGRLELQHEIDQSILAAKSPYEIAQATLESLQKIVSYQKASVMLFTLDSGIEYIQFLISKVDNVLVPEDPIPVTDFEEVIDRLKQGKSYAIGDIGKTKGVDKGIEALGKEGLRAALFVPLMVQDRLFGSLLLGSRDLEAFSTTAQEIIQEVSDSLSVALENARLSVESRNGTEEVDRLYRASETLFSSTVPDIKQLAQTIVDTVLRVFDKTNCSLFLVDQDQGKLERIAVSGPYSKMVSERQLAVDGPGLVPLAIRLGEIINVPEVNTDLDYIPNWAEARSEIAIPLKIGNQVIAVIDLQSAENDAFSQDDERLLSGFAERASLALMNARLFEETQHQAQKMASLNEQLQGLNLSLEDRVRKRTFELQVLHELSQEISYTLEYRDLFLRMLNHLHRVIDFDVAASLLLDGSQPRIYQMMTRPITQAIQLDIQKQLVDTFGKMHGSQSINWDSVFIQNLDTIEDYQKVVTINREKPVAALESTFQVPLITQSNKQLVGLLYIGAEAEAVFSESSIRLLYTLATQVSIILDRLQHLMDIEQRRLEILVERIPDGVVLLDKDKTIVLVNPSGEDYLKQLTKVGRGQVLTHLGGQEIDIFLHNQAEVFPYEIAASEGKEQVFEVDGRYIESGPEAGGWVLSIRDVTQERNLLTAEQNRRGELSALYELSRQLVETDDIESTYELIVSHTTKTLNITFCRLLIYEADRFVCKTVYSNRDLGIELQANRIQSPVVQALYQEILAGGEALLVQQNSTNIPEETRQVLLGGWIYSLYLSPLRVGNRYLGMLELGEVRKGSREPFDVHKQRLAEAITDQVTNAILRADLHQQTEERLRRLTALRQIDMAITSSVDLNMTLAIILEQIQIEAMVDAVDVLLLNPYLQTLEFGSGRGFRTSGIETLQLRIGEGFAGRVALERKIIQTSNSQEIKQDPRYLKVFEEENFVAYTGIPLISKGLVKGVLEIYNRSPQRHNVERINFLETLAGQAAIAIDTADMFDSLQRSNLELVLAYDATIEGWSHALELRDMETEGHSQRVTEMTVRLARAMSIDDKDLVHIRRGALLHDIGKMGISDSILLNPGELTEDEWEKMHQHPVYAYNMLKTIPFLRPSLDIPLYHHERWDGTGYPQGLKSEQIPLPARIFAVVDVWDALNSDRPYRKAWPEEKVIDYIREQSGKQFDPQVIATFFRILETD